MVKITYKQITITLVSLVVLMCVLLLVKNFLFAGDKTTCITATAARMDIEEKVLASGTVNAQKTVEVGAQVSGQLKKLHVALGDKVK